MGLKIIVTFFPTPDGATPLEPDEIEGLIHTHIETRDELNALESANIADGLTWLAGLSSLSLDKVLSINFIKDVHKELFGKVWEWAGDFRTTERNIGCDPTQIRLNLHNLLEDIKCWIKHEHYSHIELSARIHHQLVKIHPFPNGNGRHSRIFTDYVRVKGLGLAALTWATGEGLNEHSDERREYIDSLSQADRNNYKPLMNYLEGRGN